jgi:hypothetical protein
MMKKTLAFGIVLLFIGVAFAPSLHADVETPSEQEEYSEVTIELYGIKNFKNTTFSLNKEEYEKLK